MNTPFRFLWHFFANCAANLKLVGNKHTQDDKYRNEGQMSSDSQRPGAAEGGGVKF